MIRARNAIKQRWGRVGLERLPEEAPLEWRPEGQGAVSQAKLGEFFRPRS